MALRGLIRPSALLVSSWVVVIAAVGVSGEFPLGDDWSYAGTVRRLIEDGHLQFGDWQSVPVLPQIAIAAIACKPIGFSFACLRATTLVLWLIAGLAIVFALRDLAIAGALLVVTVLAFFLNPLVVWLAFTFMSDLPAACFTALTFAAVVRHALTRTRTSFSLAVLFAIAATLTRQTGLALIAGIAASELWLERGHVTALRRAALVTAAAVAILLGTERFLASWVGLPALYYVRHQQLVREWWHGDLGLMLVRAGWWMYAALMYVAFALAPVVLLVGRDVLRPRWRAALLLVVVALPIVLRRRSMPLLGNIINANGMGVPLLGDMSWVPAYSPALLWAITVAGAVATTTIVLTMIRAAPLVTRAGQKSGTCTRECGAAIVFTATATILVFAVHGGIGFYDRYLIALLPCLVPSAMLVVMRTAQREDNRWRVAAAIVCVALVGGWGVAATSDSLAINRVRWSILGDLEKAGVSASDIDGGFEFNGWRTGQPFHAPDARFLLAYGPQRGYRERERREVPTVLGRAAQIVVLERVDRR